MPQDIQSLSDPLTGALSVALQGGWPLPAASAEMIERALRFAAFLNRSGFPEASRSALFRQPPTAAAILTHHAAHGPDEDLVGYLQAEIRELHGSPAFDSHAKACSGRGMTVPRMRTLVDLAVDDRAFCAELSAIAARLLEAQPRQALDILGFYLAPRFCATPAHGLVAPVARQLVARAPDSAQALLARAADLPGPMAALLAQALFDAAGAEAARLESLIAILATLRAQQVPVEDGTLTRVWTAALNRRVDGTRQWAAELVGFQAVHPAQPGLLQAAALLPAAPEAALALLDTATAEADPLGHAAALHIEGLLATGDIPAAQQVLAQAEQAPVPALARPTLAIAGHNLRRAQGQAADPRHLLSAPDGPPSQAAASPGAALILVLHNARPDLAPLRRMQGVQRLFVVDAGSTDRSLHSLARQALGGGISVLRQPDADVAAARALGLARALEAGFERLMFCDPQTELHPLALVAALEALAADPQCQAALPAGLVVTAGGSISPSPYGGYLQPCAEAAVFRAAALRDLVAANPLPATNAALLSALRRAGGRGSLRLLPGPLALTPAAVRRN